MGKGMPTEEVRMKADEFKKRYHFILSNDNRAELERADGLGLDVIAVFGYALGNRYLLHLECAEEDIEIRVVDTVKESLPNFTAKWCECLKGGEKEGDIRFMDDDSCTCGVGKHHVHRVKCGHITQVG